MTPKKCRMPNAECRMPKLIFYSAFCILHSALFLVPPCSALGLHAPGGLTPPSGPRKEPSYDRRTDAFRRLLFELGFKPLQSFGELEENPNESLFILLGNPQCLSSSPHYFSEGVRSFVAQGGAMLIATDMKTDDEAGENLKKLAGVTVTGQTLVVRAMPQIGLDTPYCNLPYCPFVEPVEDSTILGAVAAFIGAGSKPDLFRRNPDQPHLKVATNAPSYLKLSGGWLPLGIHKLARLPQVCLHEEIGPSVTTSSGKYPFVNEEGPLFAVGGSIGKGRVLVLADHSIFINRMILPLDNRNLEFAANCLHWLRGGVSTPMEGLRALNSPEGLQQIAGQRNRVLFWDDGTIRNNFEVPLKKVPMPPVFPSEPAIVAAIDKTIAKLEENDSFNHALLEQIDNLPGGRERLIRSAVYLLTFAALLLLAHRFLWRTRHRPELAVPSLSKALREHEPKGPLLDQRRRALLRSGNVWEVGHRLARECFASAGVVLTSASPPRAVMSRGGRWQRWRVNRRIARLWRLARGDAPKPLSSAALKLRLRELDELKTALANGTIELT